jgi:hypothetical protein
MILITDSGAGGRDDSGGGKLDRSPTRTLRAGPGRLEHLKLQVGLRRSLRGSARRRSESHSDCRRHGHNPFQKLIENVAFSAK